MGYLGYKKTYKHLLSKCIIIHDIYIYIYILLYSLNLKYPAQSIVVHFYIKNSYSLAGY